MSRILLTAPFVGEIGWELMAWQARVRWAFTQSDYARVVVLGSAGKAAFYDGMPLDYRVVDLGHVPGAAYEDRRLISGTNELIPADQLKQCVASLVEQAAGEYRDLGHQVEVLWPEYSGAFAAGQMMHQHFIRYSRPIQQVPSEPWVVLVQRTRAFNSGKNWPESHWNELAQLLADRGVRTTVYPCEAEAAIAMLSGCDLAIGQSTGGLHLASLCGCPTMVWSVQRYHMWRWEITNRQRYETWWNPLGAPVVFHDVTQLPTPETAADQVMAALRAVGRRSGSPLGRAAFRSKWKLRTALRKRVIEPRRYERWPWLVQQFVRYQLA